MVNIAGIKQTNTLRWQRMHIHPHALAAADIVVKRLIAEEAKARYIAVQNKTSVPWPIIAVIHEREASQSWRANLAQGDPWDRRSIHVPRGRGPFANWVDAACDALINCPPHAARWTDWSIGGTLVIIDEYNGLGYDERGIPSPYLWAGTDQYRAGKFVADGHFDSHAVDTQLGCAVLLARMRAADPSITLWAEANPPSV